MPFLIIAVVLGIIYSITTSGSPNGLFLLTLVVAIMGLAHEFRASELEIQITGPAVQPEQPIKMEGDSRGHD